MNLTPEQQELGRRNFLKAVATTPALAALGAAAVAKGPVRGGPVRVGYVGLGGEGRVLLGATDPAYAQVRALCDINPAHLQKADEVMAKAGVPKATHYEDWKTMIEKEDLEAVVLAVPLWLHADMTVGMLEAGKHVLCEKMMAWDGDGCRRMIAAAQKSGKLLEIGYQRNYNPVYQAAYEGIVKSGALGDIFHARLVWHRNGTWRRKEEPPSPGYDPSRWGYPTFDHLVNWRLFWKYSQGLSAELASHQVNVANWFFGAEPVTVLGSGGVYRWTNEGREVPDHVYLTFEYPNGRTAVFTSIESNAYDHYYEAYYGTKATLILRGETEAYLFDEGGGDSKATQIEVTSAKGKGPVTEASESRVADAAGRGASAEAQSGGVDRLLSYRNEISEFCASVRTGKPLRCGPQRAIGSALACIAGNQAMEKKTRVTIG
jgi:predicted dehydrogenase